MEQSGRWALGIRGRGGKGPWGSGPQPSGPTPPDLEELLRRSQDKLRSVLPGGSLGGKGLAPDRCWPRSCIWGFSGFFRVEPDELGVVLRFGKYVRDVQPGLNYHLPYPIETRAARRRRCASTRSTSACASVDDLRRGTHGRATCRKKA